MISVVVTTHSTGRDLPGILSSLSNQRQYRSGLSTRGKPFDYEAGDYFSKLPLEVIVSWDGKPPGEVTQFADLYWPRELRWKIIENEKADPPCCGHNTREAGIRAATGDWIVLTNSDNMFFHGWLHSLMQELTPMTGLVYWDIVSNLWGWQARSSKCGWGEIDLSCVCVRAEIAKEVGFPFRAYDGDFEYINKCVELCLRAGLRASHIRQVLGVHN